MQCEELSEQCIAMTPSIASLSLYHPISKLQLCTFSILICRLYAGTHSFACLFFLLLYCSRTGN